MQQNNLKILKRRSYQFTKIYGIYDIIEFSYARLEIN